ncbi:MAG: redox-regulated ATPase YchF [Alphaproteobacteria bacterium]|nr:MAG: redox-regulated ATPase YchF [Alphaproteobacteria bacterium]
MGFKCGIVGLPNVGKSTLFNALTRTAAAQAANYPFCTIEPNTGDVAVPDPRLFKLAALAKSKKVVPTQLTFIDIAGLVRGASRGEGLGNRFLGNIREVDAIAHVLRCFADSDVTHVEGRIDPLADAETVETELMLADLESLERRIDPLRKRATARDKEALAALPMMESALAALNEGKMVRTIRPALSEEDRKVLRGLNLLTAKPVLYICNVGEDEAATGNADTARIAQKAAAEGAGMVIISAAIEAEIAQLSDDEQAEYLEAIGLAEPGLNRMIRAGYALLDLVTFFTAGPKEAHAWTVRSGARAPQAAGAVHSDFERGFIRAQTIKFDDYVALGGETQARDAGKARDEGKDYVVQDGDVILFKFAT